MTATGFLTEPVEPQLYVSYQQISLIPAGHPVLRALDANGVHEPDQDRVRVPQWVHDDVLHVINNDHPEDRPEVRGLRNIVEQPEEAMRQDRIRRLDARLMRVPTFTNTAEPAPPDPDELEVAELEDDIFDDTEEHEQVHQDFWRATQEVNTQPLTPNTFANALRTQWTTEVRDRLVAETHDYPLPANPRWFVIARTGLEHQIVLDLSADEPDAIQGVIKQFHEIEGAPDEQLEEIMTWARETWRSEHAVPEQAEEGPPEGEVVAAEDGRGADDGRGRTELHGYTITYGVPANQGAVIRNV